MSGQRWSKATSNSDATNEAQRDYDRYAAGSLSEAIDGKRLNSKASEGERLANGTNIALISTPVMAVITGGLIPFLAPPGPADPDDLD